MTTEHDDDLALAAFVQTLRGATPSAGQLAIAREGVVNVTKGGARLARVVKIFVALLAVGVGLSGGAPAARPEASAITPTHEHAHRSVPTRVVMPVMQEPAPTAVATRALETPVREARRRGDPPRSHARAAQRREPETTMQFSVSETTPPPGNEVPSPPSEALATATRAFASERCDAAAPTLARVVEGETSDAADRVQRAQWMLGVCLVRLGFPNGALAVFDEITRAGAAHARWDATLPWLGRLARMLPEPSGVGEAAARYPIARVEALAVDDEGRAERDALLYVIGKQAWDTHDPERAARLLARVSPTSRFHVPAKLVEGVAWVRLRRAVPARRAFEAALASIERGDSDELEDEDRLRDVAWLSLARLDYAAAFRTERDGSTSVNHSLVEHAVGAWRRVRPDSEAWVDATFEQSWAHFVGSHDGLALGRLHALTSPHFRDAFYPEAQVLRALTLFRNCRYLESRAEVARFHARYDGVTSAVRELVRARGEEHAGWARLAFEVNARRPVAGRGLAPVLHATLSDRALVRHLDWIRSLDRELARVSTLGPAASGPLGARVQQDVSVMRSFGYDRAGEIVQERVVRLGEELRDRTNDIDTIDLEMTTLERTNGRPFRPAPRRIEIWAEQGEEPWPFDGEYWPDELPYYNARHVQSCRR